MRNVDNRAGPLRHTAGEPRYRALEGETMHMRRSVRIACLALALGLVATLLVMAAPAAAQAGEGRVVVELQGSSSAISLASHTIRNTNNITRQDYKFKQERYGKDFHYVFSGLAKGTYNVEFSFVESKYTSPGKRRFSVYANGSLTPLTGLSNLDIYSKVGKDTAYQVTVNGVAAPGGTMDLRFLSSIENATVSNIRLVSGGETALEVMVTETRHWQALPLRFINGGSQDLQEVILGRFGSRFMVNPVPQLLGWRQSPLGTWTEDLSELVLAFRDSQGDIRCLPFTDRYPVFSAIDQELSLTGVSYVCQDPELAFSAVITVKAPFYPRDTKLSSAPFFYVDIKVSNPGSSGVSGDFMLVQPNKANPTTSPQLLGGGKTGYKFATRYNYADESYIDSGGSECWEALAVDDATGITVHTDITPQIWASPSGYPLPYRHDVYTFQARGYSGLEWSFNLAGGSSNERTVVLAGHTDDQVLTVRGDGGYRFFYRDPSGPNLSDVDAVLDYALGAERSTIEGKTAFFDGILGDAYLSGLDADGEDLATCALQSFICNTWWCSNASGDEWFSVWEGVPCMFHSTVDVEYNDAWFFLDFWPDLLKTIMQEWVLYEKSNTQGKYLSHDMGTVNVANGMAYPHDMPVEENADYILLIYNYWKTSGDTAFVKSEFGHVKDYTRFIFKCDTDGNGLPDINVANTIDQGSAAVQNSTNQTYLGVKALAAYRAASEMASAQDTPDQAFIASCEERVRLINLTLGDELWLGDHFAVCGDYSVPAADREAYSIYASNGLLYLLASSLDTGITASNLERFRTDISSAAAETARRYGYVHTSVNNENQWVSQNLWRDALGYWLGVGGWSQGQVDRLSEYWNLESYYARKKNGGFWDVCSYLDFYFLGTSEAVGLGFSGSSSANAYLEEADMEGGGVRGAYSLDSAFNQSLGYYPRGTASLSIVNAMSRLRVDIPSGFLIYDPAETNSRVPVYCRADWGAADPAKRIPVLVFNQSGGLQQKINSNLLPGNIASAGYDPITGLRAQPFSCSPGIDSQREDVTVYYDAPAGSVTSATVLDGAEEIRDLVPGAGGVTWDGKDNSGEPVGDGVYTMYLETDSPNPAVLTPSDTVEVGVNTNVPSPSRSWYLAEGYTGSNATGGEFDTWVLVQNPNDSSANITATFMQPGGVNTDRSYTLAPHSRFTIHVDDILPDAEVSTRIESDLPVVAERAMYFNGGKAGHDTIGVTSTSSFWYLAEGYTGGDFDEWVLVQNPGDDTVTLSVHLQTQEQGEVIIPYLVGPRSRFTIHVDDILPDAQVSTFIESDRPVVVERAQYLNYMRSGTCSIGARSTSNTWFFAEGYTSGGFEEFLLIQNPRDTSAMVNITFMQPDGTNTSTRFAVPARSRYTVWVDELFPDSEVSASISSNQPVVAERAMYWENRSDGHDTLGTPCVEYTWFFAEGYTSGGFEEWLLIQNPWDGQAVVGIDFMLPGGDTNHIDVAVPARSRFTINVGGVIGETEVSLKLSSDRPVVAERAMYFDERSGGTCSIGAIE
ncbi:MAG: DUF5719 family protein [Actinomycetota bacterium]|nr:DUF5719 family protein [Actinomycetota bacterium]